MKVYILSNNSMYHFVIINEVIHNRRNELLRVYPHLIAVLYPFCLDFLRICIRLSFTGRLYTQSIMFLESKYTVHLPHSHDILVLAISF